MEALATALLAALIIAAGSYAGLYWIVLDGVAPRPPIGPSP